MNDPKLFHFSRSAKAQGLRFLFVAVGMVVVCSYLLPIFVKESEETMQLIQWGIYAIGAGIAVFIALPTLRQKGSFKFTVSREGLICSFPNGTGYKVNLSDVDHLEKKRWVSRETSVDYLIWDKQGQSYLIPTNYGLSPHDVFVAIKEFLPEVDVVKRANY